MVQHLQKTGTVRIVPGEPSSSQSAVTATVTPAVVTEKFTEHNSLKQVDNLSRSIAESVLPGVNNDNPTDYIDTDNDDIAVNHDTLTREQADELLASEDDSDNAMDLLDPTGTAANPQGEVIFYNDSNVMDDPIDAAYLPAAIPAVIVTENQPDSETSSQNPTN